MQFSLQSSPHHHVRRDTQKVMQMVCLACIPGIAAQTWYFGWGTAIQISLAIMTAVITEGVIIKLRQKSVDAALSDYSAVLTAVLLGICLPPLAPWWLVVIGTFFSIAIVKQLYGGLGFNMFNPAMTGYVMLLISYPMAMTMWIPVQSMALHPYTFTDALSVIFTGYSQTGYDITQLRALVDGSTQATPLDAVRSGLLAGQTYSETLASSIFSGTWGWSFGWSPIALAYALGGLWLLWSKVINWHMPVSMLAGVVVTALILNMLLPDASGGVLYHLLSGAVLFGAFFIVTDPVSGSTTNKGRIIFGAMIGFWTVIIRTFGGYPDAVAFAVIIMNIAVPLIDYYTQPRTYGHRA
ncbi:MAG: electron transport complex subunit RsxD [Glaciecola sp.]|jgi:electron transport complex protein RnfD